MQSVQYNQFVIDASTTWSPAIILPFDLTGCKSSLVVWNSSGKVAIWAGTANMTLPTITPTPVFATLTIDVVASGVAPDLTYQSSISAVIPDTAVALLQGAIYYQWDYWDLDNVHSRVLRGEIQIQGKVQP